jgi:hypothetical protein
MRNKPRKTPSNKTTPRCKLKPGRKLTKQEARNYTFRKFGDAMLLLATH